MNKAKSFRDTHPALLMVVAMSFLVPAVHAQNYDLAITLDGNSSFSSIIPTHHDIPIRDTVGNWYLDLSTLTNSLSNNTEMDALDYWTRSDIYFSVNTSATVGAVSFEDEDVVYWNGSTFTLIWDGSANGLPANADLDALDVIAVSPLEFSLSLESDATLTVGGSPILVADEDVIRFINGSGFTAVEFDGSSEGVAANANLDALGRLSTGEWIISFNSPGTIGALSYDDADLILYDPGPGTFSSTLWFDSVTEGLPKAVDIAGVEVNFAQLNPTATPTPSPTASPTPSPTASPTVSPTASPTVSPTASPTVSPTASPTVSPSPIPNASKDWTVYE